MAQVVHPGAVVFGRIAEKYDSGRPGYPEEAVDFAFGHAGLGPGSAVLEVGAGTGRLSRSLARRVAQLILVEPAAGMRDVLRRRLPEARIREGTAESLPVADGVVQAVFAAQSFHWFDHRAALREFHRVLAPRGAVVLLWNVRDDANPVDRAVSAVIDPLRGHVPSYAGVDWPGRIIEAGSYGETTTGVFVHRQRLDAEAFADRFGSVSWIASLPDRIRAAVLRDLSTVFDRHQQDGVVLLSNQTHVYVTRRD